MIDTENKLREETAKYYAKEIRKAKTEEDALELVRGLMVKCLCEGYDEGFGDGVDAGSLGLV